MIRHSIIWRGTVASSKAALLQRVRFLETILGIEDGTRNCPGAPGGCPQDTCSESCPLWNNPLAQIQQGGQQSLEIQQTLRYMLEELENQHVLLPGTLQQALLKVQKKQMTERLALVESAMVEVQEPSLLEGFQAAATQLKAQLAELDSQLTTRRQIL